MESIIRVADGYISAQDILAYAWCQPNTEPSAKDYRTARARLRRWRERGDDDGWPSCLAEVNFTTHGSPSYAFRAKDVDLFIKQVHKYMDFRLPALKPKVEARIREAVALLSPQPLQPFSVSQSSSSSATPLPPSQEEDPGDPVEQDYDDEHEESEGDNIDDPELVAPDTEIIPLMDRSLLRPRKAYASYEEWVDHLGLVYGVDAKRDIPESVWSNPKLYKGKGFFEEEPSKDEPKTKKRKVVPTKA